MRRLAQKHGKIILTIVGVILMITFALPAFQGNRDPSKIPVGRLDGARVTTGDLAYPRAEVGILNDLGLGQITQLLDRRDPPLHWYLLTQEASKYGFDSIPTVSDEQLADMFKASGVDLEQRLLTIGAGSRGTLKSALRHAQMIEAYLDFVQRMPRPVARLEQLADIGLTQIQVEYATLDGSKGDAKADPSDQQITDQFTAYKAVLPTPPYDPATAALPPLPPEVKGHHYPFGYKYPDRVTVEYLKFDRPALTAKFKPTNEDYNEAYKYYREHPEDPLFSGDSSSAGVVGSKSKKSFDDVKSALVAQQTTQRVTRQLARMTDRALTQADAWRNLPEGQVLEKKDWPSFQKIAQDLASNREFEGFAPTVGTTGDALLSAQALNAVPGIGNASYFYVPAQKDFRFGQLATSVQELVTLSKRTPLGAMGLQVGKPGPILKDDEGSLYIYRVTAADKSHEPAKLDEVRPQVIEDLKKLAAYEAKSAEATKLAESAAGTSNSLERLATEQKIPVAKSSPFRRIDPELPTELRGIRDLTDKAFTLVPAGSTTQPATTQRGSGVGATTVLPNDDQLKLYVLQLLDIKRTTGDVFANLREIFTQRPEANTMSFLRDWINLENLAARVKYVPDQPFSKRDEE